MQKQPSQSLFDEAVSKQSRSSLLMDCVDADLHRARPQRAARDISDTSRRDSIRLGVIQGIRTRHASVTASVTASVSASESATGTADLVPRAAAPCSPSPRGAPRPTQSNASPSRPARGPSESPSVVLGEAGHLRLQDAQEALQPRPRRRRPLRPAAPRRVVVYEPRQEVLRLLRVQVTAPVAT